MGLAVYVENQINQRVYAGREAGIYLEAILRHVGDDALLAGVHLHGDTMFNSPQLTKVMGELDLLIDRPSEVTPEATPLKSILEQVVRQGGYAWVAGD